jgi:hypothetical protein
LRRTERQCINQKVSIPHGGLRTTRLSNKVLKKRVSIPHGGLRT